MHSTRPRLANVLILIAGLALGLVFTGSRPSSLQAGGGDRSGQSILTTGPVSIAYDEGTKIQAPQDALYYLDYKAGKLLATIPTFRQTVNSTRYLEPFAERDLVADFKIDIESGPRPQFLMTTGQLGTFGSGWAPLFVFESSTGQVAVYRIQRQTVGVQSQLTFELLEIRPISPAAPAAAAAAAPLP